MSSEIEAIKKRAAVTTIGGNPNNFADYAIQALTDCNTLLAEVARLEKVNEHKYNKGFNDGVRTARIDKQLMDTDSEG